MSDGYTAAVIHAAELEARAEYSPAASHFLTPAEQSELYSLTRSNPRLFFWGGYVGAERRAAVWLPEWACEGAPAQSLLSEAREAFLSSLIYGDDAPLPELCEKICPVEIAGKGLTHRSVLGSLMGLGIERDAAGDVCITDTGAVVFTVSGIDKYVCENLTKAGSCGVTALAAYRDVPFVFERTFENITTTVASMRLDCIVAALTGVSRSTACEAIERGDVMLSYEVQKNVSKQVCEGDILTVRGFGKYRINPDGGLTRKSRIRLSADKYT